MDLTEYSEVRPDGSFTPPLYCTVVSLFVPFGVDVPESEAGDAPFLAGVLSHANFAFDAIHRRADWKELAGFA